MAETSTSTWYYARAGQQQGPVTAEFLTHLLSSGQLSASDMVWRDGMAHWSPVSSIPQFQRVGPAPAMPPPIPPNASLHYYDQGGSGRQAVLPIAYASPRPPTAGTGIGQDPGIRWLLPVGRSGWAIIAGYLGLFSLVIVPAPLALIASIIAIRDIRKHPERHGMGRAIFGLVMGILGSGALCLILFSAMMRR